MRNTHFLCTAAALAGLLLSGAAVAQDNTTKVPKAAAADQLQGAAPAAKSGEGNCPAGQEANCPPKKGAAEPGMKPKGQATEEATPAKPKAAEGAEPLKPKVGQKAGQPETPKAAEGAEPLKPKVGQKDAQPETPKAAEGAEPLKPKVGQKAGQPETPKAAEGAEPLKPKVGDKGGAQPETPKAAEGTPVPPKKDMTGAATPDQPAKTEQASTPTKSTDVEVTGSLNIGREKAARVTDTLLRSGERSEVDVNVNVTVGMALPERIRPRPLPSTIVEIVPEYRGYDYVVVRDEIVIVEPSTRKVVEVIHHRGGQQANRTGGASGSIRLTEAQREKIREYARQQRVVSVQKQITLDAGASVPEDVTLVPLPDTIVTEVPAIRQYQFFVDSDQVVLVDPSTRQIVETIE